MYACWGCTDRFWLWANGSGAAGAVTVALGWLAVVNGLRMAGVGSGLQSLDYYLSMLEKELWVWKALLVQVWHGI